LTKFFSPVLGTTVVGASVFGASVVVVPLVEIEGKEIVVVVSAPTGPAVA